MIVARLYWVSFSAPQLSAEHEQTLAKAVRGYGKKVYIRDFLGLGSPIRSFNLGRFLEIHWTGLFYFTFAIVGIVMLVFDDTPAKDAVWWQEALAIVSVFSFIGAPIFYLSMINAAFSFNAWLNSLLRRHPE